MKDTIGMIVAALLLVALGFGAYWWWNGDSNSAALNPGESSIATPAPDVVDGPHGPASTEVTFTATDGYTLSSTYSVPEVGSPIRMPVLVLVHQLGTSRHDFDLLVPRLLEEGYAVLAYDSRGAGKSVGGVADKKDSMKDFAGALSFLSTQKEVDASQVGVIGASIGGNVAYVASGSSASVKVAVALSPVSTGAPKELLGTTITVFKPHTVFVATDDKDKAEGDLIFKKVQDPKQRKVYPGLGHGVALLSSDAVVQDVLSFVAQFLDIKG
mgnify:FL=1